MRPCTRVPRGPCFYATSPMCREQAAAPQRVAAQLRPCPARLDDERGEGLVAAGHGLPLARGRERKRHQRAVHARHRVVELARDAEAVPAGGERAHACVRGRGRGRAAAWRVGSGRWCGLPAGVAAARAVGERAGAGLKGPSAQARAQPSGRGLQQPRPRALTWVHRSRAWSRWRRASRARLRRSQKHTLAVPSRGSWPALPSPSTQGGPPHEHGPSPPLPLPYRRPPAGACRFRLTILLG
jgi:hypothetical protein